MCSQGDWPGIKLHNAVQNECIVTQSPSSLKLTIIHRIGGKYTPLSPTLR